MRMHNKLNPGIDGQRFSVPSSFSLVLFGILVSCVLPIRARSEGDIELLRLVATAHQANRAGIDTWQGHADIESTLGDANGIMLRDMFSVAFVSDCRRDVTRWTWIHDERFVREGVGIEGQPMTKAVLEPLSAMTTRHGFYRYAPGITTREGERLNTLVIWPPERARRRSYSECFNPMWYLTGHMTKLTDDFIGRLVFLYRRVKNDGAPYINATRNGNVVILEIDNGTVLNRHYFDLAQGGNVVKYFAQSGGDTELREWTYERKAGVWVPRTFVFNFDVSSPEYLGNTSRTWKVTFVENVVNEPVPVSQFSLKALGYKSSEQLNDQRTNLSPIYDGARTWDERILRESKALPPPAPYEELPLEFAEPLLGKPLPELNRLNVILENVSDKMTLVCFFDMNQRPSRHCLLQLAKQTETLEEKDIAVVAVQATKIDEKTIREWVKKNTIPFPVGMIQDDVERTRFNWGVRSLPWLILTDRKHIVVCEGLGLDESDKKIREVKDTQ